MIKHDSFRPSDNNTLSITRQHVSPEGWVAIFMAAGTELSILMADHRGADLDALSDVEIEKIKNVRKGDQVTFIWHNGAGFVRM